MQYNNDKPKAAMEAPSRDKAFFVPDFRDVRNLLVLVLMAELLVFVLALSGPPERDLWLSLSLMSLLVQWVALTSAAGLTLLRRWLAELGNVRGALVAYCLIVAVSGVVAYLGVSIGDIAGTGPLELAARSMGVAAIVAAVTLRYLYVQDQWQRRVESEASARVEALQARIRPHFLFNSLNTIVSLIASQPERAEGAVIDLADLFRAAITKPDRLVPVSEELALTLGYLDLEQLRLGERLQVEWAVDDLPRDALLPPLTLQPLLENAVYHGVETRIRGGTVRIQAIRRGQRLSLRITNPAPDGSDAEREGAGIAQANIRERLQFAFGADAALSVHESDDEYRIELTLPYRRDNNDRTST